MGNRRGGNYSIMKAEIISIGSELLLGQIVNTDAQYLSKQLAQMGIDIYYHTVIGDNKDRLLEALNLASQRSDIIITTGGLGPTMDDITKQTIAEFLGVDMELDKKSLDSIRRYFEKRNRPMPDENIRQALFPKGSQILPNDCGTAPGAIIEANELIYIILPGPPHELAHMFDIHVSPYLIKYSNETIYSRVLKIYGMGESAVEEEIKDLIANQHNPTIAPLASQGEVSLRITAKVDKYTNPEKFIAPVEQEIRNRLGNFIYGVNDQTLEEVVVEQLSKKKKTIAVAESCTGGLITNLLTNVPGASQVIMESFITYSNEAKMRRLNVKKTTLDKWGAVSRQTAQEMLDGLIKVTSSDIGVAVTGIAGPDGGTPDKPVGLVYIAVGSLHSADIREYHFTGNRLRIKQLTAKAALNMVRWQLNSSH